MRADECVASVGGTLILYDPRIADQPRNEWFSAEKWPPLAPLATGAGRCPPRVVTFGAEPWILRHYTRGGLVARVVEDSYVWTGPDRTRAFREWRLLGELQKRGLPVPRPVAARVARSGLTYRADLITVQIDGAVPMSALLARGELGPATMRAVGRCIARFHRAGVWHADLNAHNVQIDPQGRVFLLDFDRGCLRTPRERWQRGNLRRLRRSILKTAGSADSAAANPAWEDLVAGYAE
jgi:3-deoxy-D-manno-octulosonic acid kinase